MAAVFAVMCALAGIWSAIKYQATYHALLGSLPPQFQDPLNSRYAFPEYVLHPSTPLALQTDFVKAQAGGCFAMLCFSLSCFIGGQTTGGWLALAGSFAIAASTIKAWRIYKENCNRPLARVDREEPLQDIQ
jgi:hypothetical protein